MSKAPYWTTKKLEEMTPDEWEALCDGCGKCCLHKIEDADNGTVYFTDVACLLFDPFTCQCTDYSHRSERVPNCVSLTPKLVRKLTWLPESCAYRRLLNRKNLACWHPLVSGDPKTVHQMGFSVRGKVIEEASVDLSDLDARVIDWIK